MTIRIPQIHKVSRFDLGTLAMPFLHQVFGLLNPFSWLSRRMPRDEIVEREIEVQEDDMPEFETAPKVCGKLEADSQQLCQNSSKLNDLECGMGGDTLSEKVTDAVMSAPCNGENDNFLALEECCPSVGLETNVKVPSLHRNLVEEHDSASYPAGAEVDQPCSSIPLRHGATVQESSSATERNQKGTSSSDTLHVSQLKVLATDTASVDTVLDKKTLETKVNPLMKPPTNIATVIGDIQKFQSGKGDASPAKRTAQGELGPRGGGDVFVMEAEQPIGAFGTVNIPCTMSAKKRKATGGPFDDGSVCIVYENLTAKHLKRPKQMKRSAVDATAVKASLSSEAYNRDSYAAAAPTPANSPFTGHSARAKQTKTDKVEKASS
ncbi:hypothetical protein RB195_013342 [Necator americanus]|uniref:Uncharacterized protein n=1 Tax=Necator americanus TaxID=51031 RepID=A0ABR1DVR0_NECAM